MATAIQRRINSMTLGNKTNKMYTMIQQHSPGQNNNNNNNCVIITTQPNGNQQIQNAATKNSTVIIQQTNSSKRPLERTSVVVNNNTINIANNNNDMLRCKRKINFMPYNSNANGTVQGNLVHHHQPASVARRNARERNRVKQVNNGFATLRQHIPASVAAALSSSSNGTNSGRGASKKLSKVETLRMAVEYIRSLQQMIQEHEAGMNQNNQIANSNQQTDLIENQYYPSSSSPIVDSSQSHFLIQQTPPCSSESSASSPTPSYSSEGSISVSTPQTVYAPLTVYQPESYENYEPMSPEDEELLDVISWWQQQ